jgi:C4-dicarboxylate-specific signal transduction histidine kinase
MYLPIGDSNKPLKPGQHVEIDGVALPQQRRLDWNRTQVRLLEEGLKLKAPAIHGLGENPQSLDARLVSVEGLIDRQSETGNHVILRVVVGGTAATAYVLKWPNEPGCQFKVGDFVRMKCVCSPQPDKAGQVANFILWIARPGDVEILGALTTDSRFSAPLVLSQQYQEEVLTNELLHVAGTVRRYEPGHWVTIWDATGQIMVQSLQTQPLRRGDWVEAIGYPYVAGVQQSLRGSLYRPLIAANRPAAVAHGTNQEPIYLTARLQDLSQEELRHHPKVRLRAVITWLHAETPFVYVQDASGGARLANPTWDIKEGWTPGTLVRVEGDVVEGGFVPVVTNAILTRVTWVELPEARLVTLEQALAGTYEGEWVEMRGFVHEVTRTNGLARLKLSIAGGEFVANVPVWPELESLKGAIVRVQGVCTAVVNERHQLTGIQLWAPGGKYIQLVEPAPEDPFALPLHALGNLRRFHPQDALGQWIRTAGTVVRHNAGYYLSLQEGEDSALVLSQQIGVLQPGDRVEVVGFPENRGHQLLLREAIYRRTGNGAEAAPVRVPASRAVDEELAGRLAKAEGALLNVAASEGGARLLLRGKDCAFEVLLDETGHGAKEGMAVLQPGSLLSVMGEYAVDDDEYGKPRAFFLHLRSWNDVQVLRRPPWWTLTRLLWVLLGVLVLGLVALVWGEHNSRKNRMLEGAQAGLRKAHLELEQRVEARTQELAHSLSLLHSTLESTVDGILVVDNQGKKIVQNQRMSELWKIPQVIVEDKDDEKQIQFVTGRAKNPQQFVEKVRHLYAHPDETSHDEVALKEGTFLDRYSYPVIGKDGTRHGRIWTFRDITERKQAEAKLEEAHRQLLEASRQAGMAEVASSVLHNVGNVLNSVNISVSVIREQTRDSHAADAAKITELLEQHRADLPAFLAEENRAEQLIVYLKALAEHLAAEQATAQRELRELAKNVDHIIDIVAMQQNHAKFSGVTELIEVADVVEDALSMHARALIRHEVQIIRAYDPKVPQINLEKHKLLQILVNLVQNAKHALKESGRPDKQLTARVLNGGDRVQVVVADNGVGIPAENINKIFNHGFTTRKDGHGFGLHSAALAARELGGTLRAHSDGPGLGATFTVELPTQPRQRLSPANAHSS